MSIIRWFHFNSLPAWGHSSFEILLKKIRLLASNTDSVAFFFTKVPNTRHLDMIKRKIPNAFFYIVYDRGTNNETQLSEAIEGFFQGTDSIESVREIMNTDEYENEWGETKYTDSIHMYRNNDNILALHMVALEYTPQHNMQNTRIFVDGQGLNCAMGTLDSESNLDSDNLSVLKVTFGLYSIDEFEYNDSNEIKKAFWGHKNWNLYFCNNSNNNEYVRYHRNNSGGTQFFLEILLPNSEKYPFSTGVYNSKLEFGVAEIYEMNIESGSWERYCNYHIDSDCVTFCLLGYYKGIKSFEKLLTECEKIEISKIIDELITIGESKKKESKCSFKHRYLCVPHMPTCYLKNHISFIREMIYLQIINEKNIARKVDNDFGYDVYILDSNNTALIILDSVEKIESILTHDLPHEIKNTMIQIAQQGKKVVDVTILHMVKEDEICMNLDQIEQTGGKILSLGFLRDGSDPGQKTIHESVKKFHNEHMRNPMKNNDEKITIELSKRGNVSHKMNNAPDDVGELMLIDNHQERGESND